MWHHQLTCPLLQPLPSSSLILPESGDTNLFPHTDAALEKWLECQPPAGAGAKIEKNWDGILTHNLANILLDEAHDDLERSRLLAAMDKDSGAWLQALPLTSVGLRMDDSTLRIAVGLCLGTWICSPHLCQHCETEVTPTASVAGTARVVIPDMQL